jgi:hypothetical protein
VRRYEVLVEDKVAEVLVLEVGVAWACEAEDAEEASVAFVRLNPSG